MPRLCTISGQFVSDHGPVKGMVRFTPDQLWFYEDGITWATLAPKVVLWEDGRFLTEVTPTDWWQYTVETPAGTFRLNIPYRDEPYSLKELVDEHHLGPRPPNGR